MTGVGHAAIATNCQTAAVEFLQLERWATERPSAPAVTAPGRQSITYSRLWDHLKDTRRELRAFGVQTGEVVALVLPQGPDALTAYLAIAGEFACAPLDPSMTADECRSSLSRLAVRIVVFQSGTTPAVAREAREMGMGVLEIVAGQDSEAGVFEMEVRARPSPARPARLVHAGLLLQTSSTTGDPKLVPLSLTNLNAMAANSSRSSHLIPDDRLLSLMPLFHLHGLSAASAQLYCGGNLICTPGFAPARFHEWLRERAPTWTSVNPTILRTILTLAQQNPELPRPFFRFVRTSGSAADPQLLTTFERELGIPVYEGYSTTEAPGIARTNAEHRKPGSVGRSIGPEIVIVDDSAQRLPANIEGEIVVRGATVTSGYLDDPEATRRAFRDGWFHTGDIGWLDGEGFLYITGRKKEMINRGGQKVSPTEVDRAFMRHPAVLEAAAFAVPHPTLGEEVAAAVVMRDRASADRVSLRKFLATQLAAYKIPRRIIFLDEIPRTATGKPKRSDLAEQLGALQPDSSRSRPSSESAATIEDRLLDIWRRVLGSEEINKEDDFFLAGGDSLSAAVMFLEVERSLAVDAGNFTSIDLFDNLTVASLASALLDAGVKPGCGNVARESPAARLLPMRTQGTLVPFFCFAASSRDPFYLRHLARSLGNDRPFYVVSPPDAKESNRRLKMDELARYSIVAMRSVQPRGPYVVGGHCFGGVLAFETAQQLLAQGEEVYSLVLLDVPAPGYPKVLRNWRKYLIESGRVVASWLRRERGLAPGEIRAHWQRLKWLASRRLTPSSSAARTSLGYRDLVAELSPFELNRLTLAEYAPREFRAPIVHCIAEDEEVSTKVLEDPRSGWRDFARGGLDLRRVRGNHDSILGPDNAPLVAAEIRDTLMDTESDTQ